MLQIKQVSKTFRKRRILDDVTVSVEGIYALIGSNGAGKSTLMKVVAGLTKADKGGIAKLDGVPILKKRHVSHRNQIAFMPQDFSIYPKVSVFDSLDHLAVLKGIASKKDRKNRITAVLKEVNMLTHQDKKMDQLSGGMRKRIGIAQLLLGKPKVIILDEPTAGLDIEERIRFQHLLRSLGNTYTIMISTHIVEDIEFICSKIGIIKEGRMLFEGSPEEIKKKALHKVKEHFVKKAELPTFLSQNDVIQVIEEPEHLVARVYAPDVDGVTVSPRLIDGYISILRQCSKR